MTQEEEFVSLDRFARFENPGDVVSGWYDGYTSLEGESFGQFRIQTLEGYVRINETAQLAILKKVPVGCAVQIEYRGVAKSSAGRTVKLFDIRVPASMVPKILGSQTSEE